MRTLVAILSSLSVAWLLPAYGQSARTDDRQRPLSFYDVSVPYSKRVGDAIKFYLVDPGPVSPDSVVDVAMDVDQSGKITSYRLSRSQGSPEWERAVVRAMEKADRLPLDVDGKVPSRVELTIRP